MRITHVIKQWPKNQRTEQPGAGACIRARSWILLEFSRVREDGAALIFISKHVDGSYGVSRNLYTQVPIGKLTWTGLVAMTGAW